MVSALPSSSSFPIGLLIALLMVLAATNLRAAQQPGDRLLTDFGQQDGGLRWISVNDTVMGGRSIGGFEVIDGRVEFRGTLNTNGGGFTSIRTEPQELDLGGFVSLRLRIRGDGRSYGVRLRQSGERGWRQPSYGASFRTRDLQSTDEWQEVVVPFDRLVPSWRGQTLDRPPIEASRIESLGITLADKIDGPFALDVDQIEVCRPFEIESLEGSRRVLALYADSNVDLQLLRQWQALQSEAEALDDRDLTIAVLVRDGWSHIGDRGLSTVEAATILRHFEVEPQGFGSILIGKDGGAKARAESHVEPQKWFDQIDSMPMRRAELERRARTGER